LTEPAGLLPSSFSNTTLPLSVAVLCKRTSGVFPTVDSTVFELITNIGSSASAVSLAACEDAMLDTQSEDILLLLLHHQLKIVMQCELRSPTARVVAQAAVLISVCFSALVGLAPAALSEGPPNTASKGASKLENSRST